MTTNTTNSQVASIAEDYGFINLAANYGMAWTGTKESEQKHLKALGTYIDAKLAQAGDDWRDRANVLEARLGEVMEKRDEWRRMAEGAMDDVADHYKRLCKAEAKLAEWDKIVEVSLAQDYTNRAIAAESLLAEIQRGVEGLTRYEFRTGFKLDVPAAGMLPDVLGNYVMFEAVESLLQPQGQASICEHNIVSAVNKIVKSGMLCTKCGKLFKDDGTPI